ncbi:MAG: CheB methylesterase domain-containing protein [Cellulosilyticaceae bacterium]
MQKEGEDYKYIIAIGISTGGPKALNQVIAELPKTLPATYIVVQHMPAGFTKSLAQRLDSISELEVKEAEQGDRLQRGRVLIAPGGKQFKIVGGRILEVLLTDEPPYKSHKPAVNVMFESLAQLPINKKIIGVIMTGMGSDGLEGITHLMHTKQQGQATIIAQDEASCVVYGMPKAIVNAGLAHHVVPLNQIVKTIIKVMGE